MKLLMFVFSCLTVFLLLWKGDVKNVQIRKKKVRLNWIGGRKEEHCWNILDDKRLSLYCTNRRLKLKSGAIM